MSNYRSGFVALVGKPNVGKSTLINRLVGQKVAITSSKPQTTRHRILGVVHGDGFQVVLVDTPGYLSPRNVLGEKMLAYAQEEMKESDLVLLLGELTHAPTEDDAVVARHVAERPKSWLVLTKQDLEKKEGLREAYSGLGEFEKTFVVSAVTGEGIDELVKALAEAMPEGVSYFPPDQVSDQNQRLLAAEVIREKVLRHTRQEVPHAAAVAVEELKPGETEGVTYVNAYLYVERETQKRIVVGKGGELIKKVSTEARLELEQLWETRVFLDLWVKVKKDWRDREDWLRALGYE